MQMSEDQKREMEQRRRDVARGKRAEEVASWYFRLNGFLSIPGFVVHPDVVRRNPMTEADLIAVRFPYSQELIAGRVMVDDPRLTNLGSDSQVLFRLVEVKTDLCNINGPWSNERDGNMQRVIRRLGFARPDDVPPIATAMYQDLRWQDANHILQYITVGERVNDGRQRQYPKLVQITWPEIAGFLFERFSRFPEKLSADRRLIHEQWPAFGRRYGRVFRRMKSVEDSRQYLSQYIRDG